MSKLNDRLSDADIKVLAEFFYLLLKCDERNKREGRYKKKNSDMRGGVKSARGT